MPKIDIASLPVRSGSSYPAPLDREVAGRSSINLGDAGGLTQFGVRITMLEPGAWSSHRHWHENEDEFLMMIEGELVMVENEGETIMRPGDCAAYKAGVTNGHHMVNRSDKPAKFLVAGTRAMIDRAHYSDVDMLASKADGKSYRFTKRDGSGY
jgi:uncharacterized cupin superfamily protein